MLESLFTFLFKYPQLVFEQGTFVFWATRSMWLVALVAAGGALYALWTYRRLAAIAGRGRTTLLALRVAIFLIVVFALLRPTLQLKVAVPQQNFVGVLLDDSRSMQIADHGGQPRSTFIADELARPDAPLLTALGERFSLRVFRFSTSAERLLATGELTYQGTGTRIGEALDRARDELSGLPVAGLVVVSDGADTTDTVMDQVIATLGAQAIPVFTVGVGEERLSRDVQVTRVETPRRVLKGTALVVDVVVTQTGYAGTKVPVIVEDAGRLVSSEEITLPGNGESATVRVRFKLDEAGPRRFQFRIPVQAGEEVEQNNSRDVLIEVYDRREKILFLEGEPRFEPKFVRLAVEKDDNLQVALLQRTAVATSNAPDKYLRLGIDSPDELQHGFPSTREELFNYRGIILGSVEASAFSPEQQRMLEDFIDVRGGGLLALGGDRAFAEGGWAGTPLSNALPVVLDPRQRTPTYPPFELVARPTPAGLTHPAVLIADPGSDPVDAWRKLPPVYSQNTVGEVKPGATLLLDGVADRGGNRPILAYQRYGRGKALTLAVQDTWMWRMHHTMAVDDPTHHNFWRRMLRWLVDGVPDRVMVSARPERVQPGDPVSLAVDVYDAEYAGINDARVTARVRMPSGRVESVPMDWTVERDGEYLARFTPSEDGVHVVEGTGERAGESLGIGTASVLVAPSEAEYFDAGMRAPLLRRLASETNGRFFRARDAAGLPEAISYSGRGITVVEEKELWDMPIILIGLLGLLGAEWLYRRNRGLA
ncbi:MAG TPA: hypothetical protein VMM93_13455 [Vicinamibacterales bacterium]|nr:hypothetical protein [Vicinamibacterales bacterium]